jgi:hypothetical protein
MEEATIKSSDQKKIKSHPYKKPIDIIDISLLLMKEILLSKDSGVNLRIEEMKMTN